MTQRKKFCFVLPSFFPETAGGSELQAFFLAQELMQRGWEVQYIRENDDKTGEKEIYENLRLLALPRRHTKLKWMNRRSLFKIMRSIQADFWYCRGTISYVYPVWRAARKAGGEVIWACSADRFLMKGRQKELKTESPARRLASWLDRCLFRLALKKIDHVLLQSQTQKELLKANFGLTGVVIPNGYPVLPLKKKNREPLILWIGRVKHVKRPERFVELARRLKDSPFQFRVVGREAEKTGCLGEFLKAEKELPDFRYLGEMPREDILDLLERTRIVVNTSDIEGYSNTFIEAWMKGVPVASLKVDPDGVIGRHGLGRVSMTMEQLVQDIKDLMTDQDDWQALSVKCRAYAEKELDISQSVNALESIIGSVGSGRRPRAADI